MSKNKNEVCGGRCSLLLTQYKKSIHPVAWSIEEGEFLSTRCQFFFSGERNSVAAEERTPKRF